MRSSSGRTLVDLPRSKDRPYAAVCVLRMPDRIPNECDRSDKFLPRALRRLRLLFTGAQAEWTTSPRPVKSPGRSGPSLAPGGEDG